MATRVTPREDIIKKAKDEVEKKTGKTTEQLYEEREKRVTDAINLKESDRVPVFLSLGDFPIKYGGLSQSAQCYDEAAYRAVMIKALLDFAPDVCSRAFLRSGRAFEILNPKQYLWPGNSKQDQDLQFLNMEMMREDEYDIFIGDPGDFMLRRYLPRAFGALAPLSKLPSLQSLLATSFADQAIRFSSPEIVKAFEAIFAAGQAQEQFGAWDREIAEVGLPDLGLPPLTYPGGIGNGPFDVFVSYLRGMNGTMIDMFKRPEKLLAAMEKVFEWRLATATPARPGEMGRRVGGGANHFQSEEFLSIKQFDTFVWPTWKKSLTATIDLGYVPSMFMEGKNDDRIERFLELPKGKAFVRFEKIDMARAKDILGNHLCIGGGVPLALLWGGSPQEVEEYCKDLIKVCGKGGGFILGPAGGIGDAKPANVKAMVDSAKKYGRY